MQSTRYAAVYQPQAANAGKAAMTTTTTTTTTPVVEVSCPAAPEPVRAAGLGSGPVGADQAAHGPIHVLDATRHHHRHDRLRWAARFLLRPPLRGHRSATAARVRPSRLQHERLLPRPTRHRGARRRRHHQRVPDRLHPGHLAAAPQRSHVLVVKTAVFCAVAAVTGIVAAIGSLLEGQAVLAPRNLHAHLADPGAPRSVIGAGLYLAVVGLFALGIGTLIRRTAEAIAAVVGLIIILPVFIEGLPQAWQDAITKLLPSVAGQAVIGRTKFTPADAAPTALGRLRRALRLRRRGPGRSRDHARTTRRIAV